MYKIIKKEKKSKNVQKLKKALRSNLNSTKGVAENEAKSQINDSHLTNDLILNPTPAALRGHISDNTLRAMIEMGLETITDIQAQCIPPLLQGKNVIVVREKGSEFAPGKMLAFLIAAIELLHKSKFQPEEGTGVIILLPTRELAMETFRTLSELLKYHRYNCGFVVGGMDRRIEAEKLKNGINILVATQKRLLYHLQRTTNFLFTNLKCLIIDEIDRILSMDNNSYYEVSQMMRILPFNRQNMLSETYSGCSVLNAMQRSACGKQSPYIKGRETYLSIIARSLTANL